MRLTTNSVLLIALFICAGSQQTVAQAPDSLWSKLIGWEDHVCSGVYIDHLSDNGFVIAGLTHALGSEWDVLLVRTDSLGEVDWSQTYGGDASDYAQDACQTPDGGFLLVGSTWSFNSENGFGKMWAVKTSSDGTLEWQRTYGSGSSVGRAVACVSGGGYLLGGDHYNPEIEEHQGWVVRISESGDSLWSRYFDEGTTNSGFPQKMIEASNGDFVIAGGGSSGLGSSDFWLARIGPAGEDLWSFAVGGVEYDIARSVTEMSDGSIVATGWSLLIDQGYEDVLIVKSDANGTVEWARTYGGPVTDYAVSVDETLEGGIVVAGQTWSFGTGGSDLWVLKVDSDGDSLWSRIFGGVDNDGAGRIVQLSDGTKIIAGGTASFGIGPSDVWVIKLEPECGGLPPAAPNIVLVRSGQDMRLSWNPVAHSAPNCPLEVAGYRVFYRQDHTDLWSFLEFTDDTTVTHLDILDTESALFYHVVTVSE